MGKGSSKEQRQHDSSASYVNSEENAIEEVPTLHTGPIHSLCVVDAEHFASGGADKDIVLYCWTAHINRARFMGPTKDVTKINYNPKSCLLYAASRDRVVHIWKWPTDEPDSNHMNSAAEVFHEPTRKLERHTLGVTALACSETSPHLLCSGSRDNSVCLWDADTGTSVSSMHIPRNLVTGLEWIEPEMAVLQSSEDKTLRVWDLRSCSVVRQFRARQYVQTCCAVSADGNYFLGGSSGSASNGSELNLWDRRVEKKPVKEFRGHTESVQGCHFLSPSKDRSLITSVGNDSTVRIWDRESGRPRPASHRFAVRLSRTASDGKLDELHSEYIAGAGPLTAVVSPSQGLVACSSFKAGVVIWTVQSQDNDSYTLTLRAKY